MERLFLNCCFTTCIYFSIIHLYICAVRDATELMFKEVRIVKCNFLEENFIDEEYGPLGVWPGLKQVTFYGSGIDRVVRKRGLVKLETLLKSNSMKLSFENHQNIVIETLSDEHFRLLKKYLGAMIEENHKA